MTCGVVIGSDLEAAAAYVLVLRGRGLTMETLFIELLEPTACHLGEMWDRDDCDFIDVTLGVARLQKLLAIFNESHNLPKLEARRHVLMALAPSEQHRFGLTMVQRFYWRPVGKFRPIFRERASRLSKQRAANGLPWSA